MTDATTTSLLITKGLALVYRRIIMLSLALAFLPGFASAQTEVGDDKLVVHAADKPPQRAYPLRARGAASVRLTVTARDTCAAVPERCSERTLRVLAVPVSAEDYRRRDGYPVAAGGRGCADDPAAVEGRLVHEGPVNATDASASFTLQRRAGDVELLCAYMSDRLAGQTQDRYRAKGNATVSGELPLRLSLRLPKSGSVRARTDLKLTGTCTLNGRSFLCLGRSGRPSIAYQETIPAGFFSAQRRVGGKWVPIGDRRLRRGDAVRIRYTGIQPRRNFFLHTDATSNTVTVR